MVLYKNTVTSFGEGDGERERERERERESERERENGRERYFNIISMSQDMYIKQFIRQL